MPTDEDQRTMTPEAALAALSEIRDRIQAAARGGGSLRLHGGRTKDFYGEPARGEALDLRGYAGVVDYEPTELVLVARAGTPLAQLRALLDEHGQMLAFEPPSFGEGATLGGAIATGLSGPRRASAGSARDFVLGAALIDGQGELMYFGGQVMKNVAGYDVPRVLCGSLGILGVIAEVSLKVLPRPAAECTLELPMGADRVIEQLNRWGGQPLPISASAWQGDRLWLRLSGARAAVDRACALFRDQHAGRLLEADAAERHWLSLREQTAEFFGGDAPLWRLSVPATAPLDPADGPMLIEWGGALRWLRRDATEAQARALRARAAAMGGEATLFRRGSGQGQGQGQGMGGDGGIGGVPVFTPLARGNRDIHHRLKQVFDPKGLFNPGRMFPDL